MNSPSSHDLAIASTNNVSRLDLNESTDLAHSLTVLLADTFALYMKTKNFHWHMSGPHFRDYHLLLDEQSEQLIAMTDVIAERGRKIGGPTLRSIGQIGRLQRLSDNNEEHVNPGDMLAELKGDNLQFTHFLRELHSMADQHEDVATASLIETWIDEAERRVWFLTETCRASG